MSFKCLTPAQKVQKIIGIKEEILKGTFNINLVKTTENIFKDKNTMILLTMKEKE